MGAATPDNPSSRHRSGTTPGSHRAIAGSGLLRPGGASDQATPLRWIASSRLKFTRWCKRPASTGDCCRCHVRDDARGRRDRDAVSAYDRNDRSPALGGSSGHVNGAVKEALQWEQCSRPPDSLLQPLWMAPAAASRSSRAPAGPASAASWAHWLRGSHAADVVDVVDVGATMNITPSVDRLRGGSLTS